MLRKVIARGSTAVLGYLDRIVCLLGAVGFAQAPEFFQQYFQRLGGHLDEARRVLAQFELAARASGKPFERFVTDTLANPDPGLAKLGQTMHDTAARVADLQAAHQALADANAWSRPWAFARHLDSSIAHATLDAFKPAVPTTLEGALYAALGLAVAFTLWYLSVRLPLEAWSARRATRAQLKR